MKYPHAQLKWQLERFWKNFSLGKKRFKGRKNAVDFPKDFKIKLLQEFSNIVIGFKNQSPIYRRRQEFDQNKARLHDLSYKGFGICFCCPSRAVARHHIIQLQNGGINSRLNIVSVCDSCHAEIHPWLKAMKRKQMIRHDQSLELPLDVTPRICVKCKINPIYMDIESMDYCESCLWDMIKEDQNLV